MNDETPFSRQREAEMLRQMAALRARVEELADLLAISEERNGELRARVADLETPIELPVVQCADVSSVTRAVRKADAKFEIVGGSSRHWVIDCLLPSLAEEGLAIVAPARPPHAADEKGGAK